MLSTHISHQIYAKLSVEATFNQKKIIEKLSEWVTEEDYERIFLLNGYAGTGKTTIIAAFVAALNDLGIKTILLAPTGRAAKVLSHYAKKDAYTIHKKIYRERTMADYESKFSLDFNKDKNVVYIVDEASMLSTASSEDATFGSGNLLEDLIKYVRSGKECRL
ncbi:MAG: AAA family ATPase, partial [Alistipes sp.]|nr:AAA family ATPase [Alistipes sp.]